MIVVVLWLIAFEQIARLSAEDALETGPHLKLSLIRPVTKVVGDDALLTCVVTNQGDFSVMWKKTTQPRRDPYILSANSARVTSDQRVEVLHETGGTVYVLKISNVTIFDAGIYFCEVNTNPPVRSFHDLKVLKKLPKIKLPSPPPPFNSSNPQASLVRHVKDNPCSSGWCYKQIDGELGDAANNAMERGCMVRKPSDGKERCAYVMKSYKRVFICFCQGDQCNSAGVVGGRFLLMIALTGLIWLL